MVNPIFEGCISVIEGFITIFDGKIQSFDGCINIQVLNSYMNVYRYITESKFGL